MVKTVTRNFLIQELKRCPDIRGKSVHAVAKERLILLLAYGWRDCKVLNFVSMCGTMGDGTPAKK